MHAYQGDHHHDCQSVAATLDHLVNRLILPDHPLTNQGQRLHDLIVGPHARDIAHLFRDTARTRHIPEWCINQSTERLTLAVPHVPDPAQHVPTEPTRDFSLHQSHAHLVLTVPYNYTTFFSQQAPLLGNLCLLIL